MLTALDSGRTLKAHDEREAAMRYRHVLAAVTGLLAAMMVLAATPAAAEGTLSGTLLDSTTGAPVVGATVQLTDEAGVLLYGLTDTSDAAGAFSIGGLTGEEYGVFVDGLAVDYEVGYVGAVAVTYGWHVVPTWLQASTWAPFDIGDIALDPLGRPN